MNVDKVETHAAKLCCRVLAEVVLVAERKSAGTEIGLVGENDEDLVVVRYNVER